VESELDAAGFVTLLGHNYESVQKQTRWLRAMLEYGVDALIICPAHGTTPDTLQPLVSARMPYLLMTRYVEGYEASYVGADNVLGTRLATDHLLDHGCPADHLPRRSGADDEELTRRLLARAALEHRSDGAEEVIRHRLEFYRTVTHPIVDWYAERGILVSVDAIRPAERVGRQILTALEAMRPLVDHVPEHVRRSIDLTGLDAPFGQKWVP
jgi:hypothetical protein